jgi:hypothetical protein
MPYGALRAAHLGLIAHVSPMSVVHTQSDVNAYSPAATSALSTLPESPSGLSRALRHKESLERAWMLVEGRHEELLQSLSKREQMYGYLKVRNINWTGLTHASDMSTWLHHFWLFAFKTAKNWGRGPVNWTQGLLELDLYPESLPRSNVHTPAVSAEGPPATPTHLLTYEVTPSMLCKWAIHATNVRHEVYDDCHGTDSTPTRFGWVLENTRCS